MGCLVPPASDESELKTSLKPQVLKFQTGLSTLYLLTVEITDQISVWSWEMLSDSPAQLFMQPSRCFSTQTKVVQSLSFPFGPVVSQQT